MNRLMQRAHYARRRIPAVALLLASFLQICGCNPIRTCDQWRRTRLSAMPFETLLEQCSHCLSGQELTSLRRARESQFANDSESPLLQDATLEENLGELHAPSFNTDIEGARSAASVPVGGGGAWSSDRLLQQAKPIAWPIPESVLFLYAAPPSGPGSDPSGYKDPPRQIAAAFILSVPERRGQTARYLVTARHVVDPEWAHCRSRNPRSITVRFNRLGGGVGYESIPLDTQDGPAFITATDDVTDLALIPISSDTVPRLSDYKLAETPFDKLPSESELATLKKEQQIVTVGVSGPKLAGLVDSPISEPGVISTDVSGSRMGVRCTVESPLKPIHIWLVDAAVESAVSGAPIYAALPRAPGNLTTPVLVGIQAVVWPDKGRAGITPVTALRNLIEQARARSEVAINLPKGHLR